MTWRAVGRLIYFQQAAHPSEDDMLIGVMDTPGLAEKVVDAVNQAASDPALAKATG